MRALLIPTLWLVSCGLSEADVGSGAEAETSASELTGPVRYLVGPEEKVYGPTAHQLDMQVPFHRMRNGKVRGYLLTPSDGPARTVQFTGPSLDSVFEAAPYALALSPRGATGPQPYDTCGSWLTSVIPLASGQVAGYYHGEHSCSYATFTTHKNMQVAVSNDDGATFSPLGPILDGSTQHGAGDATVVQRGSYLNMFFGETVFIDGVQHVPMGVARTPLSSALQPGAWLKLYGSTWEQPAIGGRFTSLGEGWLGSRVVFDQALGRYLVVRATARWGSAATTTAGDAPGPWGASVDLVPPVSGPYDGRADDWINANPTDQRLALVAYGSIAAPDGNQQSVGDSFYLYYVKLPPFSAASWYGSYLMRRHVKVVPAGTHPYPAQVGLATYASRSTGKRVTSIDHPLADGFVDPPRPLGYLSSNPAPDHVELIECYYPGWDDHMIKPWVSPGPGANPTCPNTAEKLVRRLGWLSRSPTATATVPLIECFDPSRLNHFFVTRAADCGSAEVRWTLGYMAPWSDQRGTLALDVYEKVAADGRTKQRMVSRLSKSDATLRAKRNLGRIYATPSATRVPLHECLINIWDDYMTFPLDTPLSQSSWCKDAQYERYIGVVGWVEKAPTAKAQKQLTSCFSTVNLNHFLVTTGDCGPGATKSYVYGYIE